MRSGDRRGVAEGGRHQQEGGARQGDQRHLPGDAALGVAVVVELVHHHVVGAGLVSLAQSTVHQHLGGAADDRRFGVDGGVAGLHAHQVGAQIVTEAEELLARQRLDRAGVEASLALAERLEVHGHGHQRLARAGGGVEDHVAAGHDLEDRLLLRRVEVEADVGHPAEEEVENLVGIAEATLRDAGGEVGGVTARFCGRFGRGGWILGDSRHGRSSIPHRPAGHGRRSPGNPSNSMAVLAVNATS